MKQVLMFVAICMIGLSTKAQQKTDSAMHKPMHSKMTHSKQKDGVMMKDGKMMQSKSGKTMMMDKEMTFPNGATVMMDGTMKMKDGTTHMLKEGDCVLMNGKMQNMPMKNMMKKPM